MTKEEIIRAIWNELPNHTLKKARQACDTTFNLIRDTLSKGEDVDLRGFGFFRLREKNERMGRNPKTGLEAVIKPRKVVTFKPSNIFREQVMKDHRLAD